jgi:prolyl-tRNA synthetase
VAEFLKVDAKQTVKAGCYVYGRAGEADSRLLLAFVRGDRRFNEVALTREAGASWLRPAEDDELTTRELPAGYLGPLTSLPAAVDAVRVDAEASVLEDVVAGANRAGYHVTGVSVPKALEGLGARARVADLRAVGRGDPCPQCATPLEEYRGIEGGHIFVLGTHYTVKMNARYQDEKGQERPIVMGCYGIGVSRLVAGAVEQRHDADGIVWPMAIAPYHVVLTPLAGDEAVKDTAERLYRELTEAGVEVLLDDREERPGVKFKDADLLGIPLRVTLGKKALDQGKVELKARDSKTVELVDAATAAVTIAARVRAAL